MKFRSISKALIVVGVGGWATFAWGALRPEGDKIEFSPVEELKVPVLKGSDPDRPIFNFNRRDGGGSFSDVPSAVALPSPEQVNRLKALQDLIEQKASWALPGEEDEDSDAAMSLRPKKADVDITIDDLMERRSRLDRGNERFDDRDRGGRNRDRDRDRDADDSGRRRDRRDRDFRDYRDRSSRLDELGLPGEQDPQSGSPRSGRDREGRELGSSRREGTGPRDDSLDGRPGSQESYLDFSSLVPRNGSFMKDGAKEREAPTREERLESLRRVLGSSADAVLGPAVKSKSGADSYLSPSTGVGGTSGTALMGTLPGGNRGGSDGLDSRIGTTLTSPSRDDGTRGTRFSGPSSRPFELDLDSGRQGYGSRSERLSLVPAPAPMEMFRKKHDIRLPSRDF